MKSNKPNPYVFPSQTNILFGFIILATMSSIFHLIDYSEVYNLSIQTPLLFVLKLLPIVTGILILPLAFIGYKRKISKSIGELKKADSISTDSIDMIKNIIQDYCTSPSIELLITPDSPLPKIIGSKKRAYLLIPENFDTTISEISERESLPESKVIKVIIGHEIAHYLDDDHWKIILSEYISKVFLVLSIIFTTSLMGLEIFISDPITFLNGNQSTSLFNYFLNIIWFPLSASLIFILAKYLRGIRESQADGWVVNNLGISRDRVDKLVKRTEKRGELMLIPDPNFMKISSKLVPDRSKIETIIPDKTLIFLIGFLSPMIFYSLFNPYIFNLFVSFNSLGLPTFSYLYYSMVVSILIGGGIGFLLAIVLTPFYDTGILLSQDPKSSSIESELEHKNRVVWTLPALIISSLFLFFSSKGFIIPKPTFAFLMKIYSPLLLSFMAFGVFSIAITLNIDLFKMISLYYVLIKHPDSFSGKRMVFYSRIIFSLTFATIYTFLIYNRYDIYFYILFFPVMMAILTALRLIFHIYIYLEGRCYWCNNKIDKDSITIWDKCPHCNKRYYDWLFIEVED